MQYLGGKSRLAKRIVRRVAAIVPSTRLVYEPFFGGAAVTKAFAEHGFYVVASDIFPGLAEMFQAVCAGYRIPPHGATDAEYLAARNVRTPQALATMFGLSFGGKYGGGLARPAAKYARHFNNRADELAHYRNEIAWMERGYMDVRPISGSIIYCDPPYIGTTGYMTGTFDHSAFFAQCMNWARSGAHVFVSEFSLPSIFTVVEQFPRKIAVTSQGKTIRPERVDLLGYLPPCAP